MNQRNVAEAEIAKKPKIVDYSAEFSGRIERLLSSPFDIDFCRGNSVRGCFDIVV